VNRFLPDRTGWLVVPSQADPDYVLVNLSPRGEIRPWLVAGIVVPDGDVFGDVLVERSSHPMEADLTVMIVREPVRSIEEFEATVRVLRRAADEAVREATEGQ
jgi:hypothetical protein